MLKEYYELNIIKNWYHKDTTIAEQKKYEQIQKLQQKILEERRRFERDTANYWQGDEYDNGIIITSAEAIYDNQSYIVVSYPRMKYSVRQIIKYMQKCKYDKRQDTQFSGCKLWIRPLSHVLYFGITDLELEEKLHYVITKAKAVVTISDDLQPDISWYSCAGSFIEQLAASKVMLINDIATVDMTLYTERYISNEINKATGYKLDNQGIQKTKDLMLTGNYEKDKMISILSDRYDDVKLKPFESISSVYARQDISKKDTSICQMDYQFSAKALVDSLYIPQTKKCFMPQSLRYEVRNYKYTASIYANMEGYATIYGKYVLEEGDKVMVLIAVSSCNELWSLKISKYKNFNDIEGINAHVESIVKHGRVCGEKWKNLMAQHNEEAEIKINNRILKIGADEYEAIDEKTTAIV